MSGAEVVAVVPVHDAGPSLADLVSALAPQVSRVVLVDDGSTDPGTASVLRVCADRGATVVALDGNQGIAAALNAGIAEASRGELHAVLTLDQDSGVDPDVVPSLLATQLTAQAMGIAVGIVVPEHVGDLPSQARHRRNGFAVGRDPVQSGMLVPRATLDRVGGFDESLFIDGVDADYALRVLDAGLAVLVAEGVALEHRLGSAYEVAFAGRRLTLTRAAPFRYYYLARNRSRLVRRYARRHPGWAAGQALGLARHLAVTLALAPERRARAGAAWAGLRDAARGVTGPRPPRPER